MAEGEPPLFASLNAGHPNVVVVDETNEVGVPRADLGVHACARTLALNFNRLHRRSLHKQRRQKTSEVTAAVVLCYKQA